MTASLRFALVLGMAVLTGQAARADVPLDGKSVRDLISGKRIYLSVPLGGELPLYYRKDGQVDGSGEAAGLGRFLKPTDSGRWWIDGNRLCQKWRTWYDGRVFCFTLAPAGRDKVAWMRDDGEKGVARIGD
ncbi:hypothetical protein [uncultured Alsobacter sp.]|uniref:hypothetical protein n=1 Tax=uncultured Alsobacter sp. TaxID=1748258 RepID=UPI0025E1A69A|nr:hypothetical protein [uncultured Alsobacter sp.]